MARATEAQIHRWKEAERKAAELSRIAILSEGMPEAKAKHLKELLGMNKAEHCVFIQRTQDGRNYIVTIDLGEGMAMQTVIGQKAYDILKLDIEILEEALV